MGCGGAGLSPADQADVEAITQKDGKAPPADVCLLAKLSANCAAASESGWCYMEGDCSVDAGTMCDQSICTGAGFHVGEGYSLAWRICP
jgi:hypothetical protein